MGKSPLFLPTRKPSSRPSVHDLRAGQTRHELTLSDFSRNIQCGGGKHAFPAVRRFACTKCGFQNRTGKAQCTICAKPISISEGRGLFASASVPARIGFGNVITPKLGSLHGGSSIEEQAGSVYSSSSIEEHAASESPSVTRDSASGVFLTEYPQRDTPSQNQETPANNQHAPRQQVQKVTSLAPMTRTASAKLRALCNGHRSLQNKADGQLVYKKSLVVTRPAWTIKRLPRNNEDEKLAELNLTSAQKLGIKIQGLYPPHKGWGILKKVKASLVLH